MLNDEMKKRACSIVSKQIKIWGTWGSTFAAQLYPDASYCYPLAAMALAPLFEGDNLYKFIFETNKKASVMEEKTDISQEEWDGFVKSILMNVKEAKRDEQISIAADIFLDAYAGKIRQCADAELYIEIILEMSQKEIEFLGCLYKYYQDLNVGNPSVSIVDFNKIQYVDKNIIHPLLNRLIARGVVVESSVDVVDDENNGGGFDITLSERKFYPTPLGYEIAEYLKAKSENV